MHHNIIHLWHKTVGAQCGARPQSCSMCKQCSGNRAGAHGYVDTIKSCTLKTGQWVRCARTVGSGNFKALQNDTSREFSIFNKEYFRHLSKNLQINDMMNKIIWSTFHQSWVSYQQFIKYIKYYKIFATEWPTKIIFNAIP